MGVRLTSYDYRRLKNLEERMAHVVNAHDESQDSSIESIVPIEEARAWLEELSDYRKHLLRRRDRSNDGCPAHYLGDGWVTCEDAMESMLSAAPNVRGIVARWWADALKYVWRWPLKNHPLADIGKADSCLERLGSFVRRGDWVEQRHKLLTSGQQFD